MPRAAVAVLTVSLFAFAGCAPRAPALQPAPAPLTLSHAIDSITARPPLHRTHWGIHVEDAVSGAVLYSRNAEQLFIPASNAKLVIGAAALARFGEDHRYRTVLRAAAPARDAASSASARDAVPPTWQADSVPFLLLVAAGDPTWSARFHDSPAGPLDSLARAVAQQGVRAAGELVIDATAFTDERVHSAWEVGDLPFSYAPPVDAFAVAEGTFRLVLRSGPEPGSPGGAAVAGPVPQPFRARVTTDTAGATATVRVDYLERRDTIIVAGTVAMNATDTTVLAVTRPAHAAAHALADALRRAGVAVGTVRIVRDTAVAARLRAAAPAVVAVHVSPPMGEIVSAMLRPSQNWMAEQLLKSLGAVHGDEGSWRGGLAVQRRFLIDDVGLDSTALNLRDASGLSAQNLLTPAGTVRLLMHARSQPWGAAYRAGLPMPGQTGGTLASRLEPVQGRVWAKTGTIANVNSLGGYMVTDAGRQLAFSIYTNASGQPAAAVRRIMDEVVLALARIPQRP